VARGSKSIQGGPSACDRHGEENSVLFFFFFWHVYFRPFHRRTVKYTHDTTDLNSMSTQNFPCMLERQRAFDCINSSDDCRDVINAFEECASNALFVPKS
jgi:hypothetical protein